MPPSSYTISSDSASASSDPETDQSDLSVQVVHSSSRPVEAHRRNSGHRPPQRPTSYSARVQEQNSRTEARVLEEGQASAQRRADDQPVTSSSDTMPSASRKRPHAEATAASSSRQNSAGHAEGDGDDEHLAAASSAGPSRKRRNTGASSGFAGRRNTEPIVIDDVDDAPDDAEGVTQIKETLQRQREEQVMAQTTTRPGDSPQKLVGLQCTICLDSFTDMTATSCGHIFCHECLAHALKASEARRNAATGLRGRAQCPICRTNLSRKKKGDIIPLLLLKKAMATQPRRAREV